DFGSDRAPPERRKARAPAAIGSKFPNRPNREFLRGIREQFQGIREFIASGRQIRRLRTHPAIVLDPDAEVLELGFSFSASGEQLGHVPPIHAEIEESAADAEGGVVPQAPGKKTEKAGGLISLSAIAKERWWICPSPVAWPSIG